MSLMKVFSFGVFLAAIAHAHNYGLHFLDGEPGPIPNFPEISGPFEIQIVVQFSNLAVEANQTVLEFSNDLTDVVWFGQEGTSTNLRLRIGSIDAFVAQSAIIESVKSTFRFGVDAGGTGYLLRDEVALPVVTTQALPTNVLRPNKLLGESVLLGNRLHGGILGIQINDGGQVGPKDLFRYWNLPGQTYGPFTISFHARFDKTTVGDTNPIFDISDFGIGGTGSFVLLQAVGSDMMMTIKTSSSQACMNTCRLVSFDAVRQGEWALWHASVDASGIMSITKNGESTGLSTSSNSFHGLEPIPNNNFQQDILIGELGGYRMEGVILGLRVDQHTLS